MGGVAGCCAKLHTESEWDALTRKQRRLGSAPTDDYYQDYYQDTEWGSTDAGLGDAFGPDDFYDDFDPDDLDPDVLESGEMVAESSAPSLPIILFSAASGVSGGVIGFFISYRWLQWGVELSAGLATLALLFSLGVSGAALSAFTGSRAAPVNILFSCGVILLAIFFLALCLLVGALVGTVVVRL